MVERQRLWSRFLEDCDIVVYHTGKTAHWVEVTRADNGEVLEKRKFQSRNARSNAIAHAMTLFDRKVTECSRKNA